MLEIILWTLGISFIPNMVILVKLLGIIKNKNFALNCAKEDQRRAREKVESLGKQVDEEIIKQSIKDRIYYIWKDYQREGKYHPHLEVHIDSESNIELSITQESEHEFIKQNFMEELRRFSGLANDRYQSGYLQGIFDHASGTIDTQSLASMRFDLNQRLQDSTTKRYERPFNGLLT